MPKEKINLPDCRAQRCQENGNDMEIWVAPGLWEINCFSKTEPSGSSSFSGGLSVAPET